VQSSVGLASPVPDSNLKSGNYYVYLPFVINAMPPLSTTSYYLQITDTQKLYNLGCDLGHRDRDLPGTQNNIVVLAMGKPVRQSGQEGAYLWGSPIFSPTITSMAEQFGRAYYICTGSDLTSQLRLTIGTSNYFYGTNFVTYGHGQQWARIVNAVGSWFARYGYDRQVTVAGASDMELGWNSAYTTTQWVNGYLSLNSYPLYNYGDAAGCPNCGGGTYIWSRYDVWYISWGASIGEIAPLPLIYHNDGDHARQWAGIALYSATSRNSRMNFAGVMTQSGACQQVGCNSTLDNTPEEGWTQLWTELGKDSRTSSSLPWATDIEWCQPSTQYNCKPLP
jgi:hypothetical protein